MSGSGSFSHPRYRLLRLLGRGGAARVYLARDRVGEPREVALKILPASTPREKLRNEFEVLRRLRHPGIARAFHCGASDSGEPFFTMEYVRGRPLGVALEPHRRKSSEAARAAAAPLFLQAARALGYLHRKGLLHLDVKPDNILVVPGREGEPGRAVLLDFGLVRRRGSSREPVREGTLPYVAPELFRGEPPRPSYDVYSLGVTFCVALSGEFPLRPASPRGWARACLQQAPRLCEAIEPPLRDIILRMLVKDPRLRFADADAVAGELASEAIGGGAPPRAVFHEPEFVGRERELDRCARWLEEKDAPRPLLIVQGAAGTGRSRLLDELEIDIESRGLGVARVNARDDGGDLVRLVAHALSVLSRGTDSGEHAGTLLRIARGRPPASQSDRTRLVRSSPSEVRRAQSRIAALAAAREIAEHGLFLLIDDVERADTRGREFVDDIVRSLTQWETRPRAGPTDPARGSARSRGGLVVATIIGSAGAAIESAGAGDAVRVRLAPFTAAESEKVRIVGLDESLPAAAASRLAARRRELRRRTGGHPLLFVRGLVDLAGAPGVDKPPDPAERITRDVVELRGDERDLLTTLALLRRPASAGELAHLTELSTTRVAGALRRLRESALVSGLDRSVRPIHECVERTIEGGLSRDRLRDLHRRLAERLEAAGERPGEAARHCLEAGQQGKALAAAGKLAARLKREPWSGRPGDDDVLLEVAAAAGPSRSESRELIELAGDLREADGRYEECLAARRRLARSWGVRWGSRAPDEAVREPGALRALCKLGAALWPLGRTRSARRCLDLCLRQLAAAGNEREAIVARAQEALLCHYCGDAAGARKAASDGIRAWERLGPSDRARTLQPAVDLYAILGQVHIRGLDPREAIRWLRRGLSLVRRAIAPANSAVLLNNLGLAYHMAQRFAEALDTFEKASAAAHALGDGAAVVSIGCNRAQILAKQGHFEQARKVLDACRETEALGQTSRLELGHRFSEALVEELAGHADPAAWSAVEDRARSSGDGFLAEFARLHRGEAHAERGELAAAFSCLDREGGLPLLDRPLAARRAWLEALCGREEEARRFRSAHEAAPAPGAVLFEDQDRYWLGVAALEIGETATARRLLERSARRFATLGHEPQHARCELRLAELEIGRGRPRDALERIARLRAAGSRPSADPPASPHELRLALIEARALLAATRSGGDVRSALEKVRERVARATADSTLADFPFLEIELEAVRASAALLRGDVASARASGLRARLRQRRLSSGLDPRRAACLRRRDPWTRLSLADLRPPRGRVAWSEASGSRLEELLRELGSGSSAPERRRALLAELARDLGARHAVLEPVPTPAAAAGGPGEADRGAKRAARGERRIGIEARGNTVAVLRLGGSVEEPPRSAAVRRAIAIAPLLLAAHSHEWAEEAEPTAPAVPVVRSTGPASDRANARVGAPEETELLEPTRPLAGHGPDHETAPIETEEEGVGFVAESPASRKLLRLARSLASARIPLLITGESGTGKDLLARVVHRASPRRRGPFLSQSCAAIPSELFEADLFGYRRGAFSGADATHTGFLFQADGGTFVLEEIAELDLESQARLLRLIEHQSVRPLGDAREKPLDVRFLATTQHDLEALVAEGRFREDLFFRISAGRIHVPPLRERPEDTLAILDRFCREAPGGAIDVEEQARERLIEHRWRGNIRELLSVLERLAISARGCIRLADVEAALGPCEPEPLFARELFQRHSPEELARGLEQGHLRYLWQKHHGDIDAMARELGTSTRSVYRRFERHGLRPTDLGSVPEPAASRKPRPRRRGGSRRRQEP